MLKNSALRSLVVLLPLVSCQVGQHPDEQDFEAAPFVPTPLEAVRAMLEMAQVEPGDVIYDLGSGDGRIPIMAAEEFGARGVGIELKDYLVEESVESAREAGLADRVTFLNQDFFTVDLSEATVVTLYLLPEANLKLRPKLLEELAPGSRIVSHAFDMGDWEPDLIQTVDNAGRTLYLWIVPARVEGVWRWDLEEAGSQRTARLNLRQEFQKLTPELTLGDEVFSVHTTGLIGDRITLEAQGSLDGEPVRLELEGRVAGNRIEGRAALLGLPGSEHRSWEARRED